MKPDKKLKIYQISIVIVLFAGILIGYFVLPNTYVTQLVEERSGEYINYFDYIQEYFKPFNETDIVTAHWSHDQLYIEHTVPNERGIPFFHFGFDDDGFIRYIEQWRD